MAYLERLTIKNFVLIESLTLSFQKGFTALTGETGAGKSILLDALSQTLGERAESRYVRKGCNSASITAEYDVTGHEDIQKLFQENGLEFENILTIRRQIDANGRGRSWINDQSIGAALLKKIGKFVLEYHGQFDTAGLMDPSQHLEFLDLYAGLTQERKDLDTLYQNWCIARKAHKTALEEFKNAQKEEDYIRHAAQELEEICPEDNEEDDLLARRKKLKDQGETEKTLSTALNFLTHDSGGESALIEASRQLDKIDTEIFQNISQIINTLDEALNNTREAIDAIESTANGFYNEDITLEDIEDRLYGLRDLARKHHCQVNDLPQLLKDFQNKLEQIDYGQNLLPELKKAEELAKQVFYKKAQAVSKQRQKAAQDLDNRVLKELFPLKMEKAKLKTFIKEKLEDHWTGKGMDTVEFCIATNNSEQYAPMDKIASGGERSRFLLALKVVLADTDTQKIFIFDEIDSGVGGMTAHAIGDRLSKLSKHHQLLAVTHSPQVAACADHHMLISKSGENTIKTDVIHLKTYSDRQEEIARMLSGSEITNEARAAAKKLLIIKPV